MNFVAAYVKKPHLLLSIVLLLAVVGVVGFFKMPVNLFPDSERPQIAVVTVWPGASAGDVSGDVSRVIEKELKTCRARTARHLHVQRRSLGSHWSSSTRRVWIRRPRTSPTP